jgi:flagellar basal-body rod modification protein FlgD
MTSPVSSSSGVNVTSNSTNSNSSVPAFTQDYNTFLTMLTTQLKNQDPLSPMDTSQFTQQLVAFSQVEQQINTNNNLQQLIQMQTTDQAVNAAPLVGQTVEFSSPTTALQSGNAYFSYTLPSGTAQTELLVEDASGNVVYQTTGQTTAGKHDFQWNGQSSAGVQMPDGGQYTLVVQAVDSTQNPVTATVDAYGAVDGVNIANSTDNSSNSSSGTATSQAMLDIDGLSIPLSQLMAVNPKINPGN